MAQCVVELQKRKPKPKGNFLKDLRKLGRSAFKAPEVTYTQVRDENVEKDQVE